ncbi:MAG TPA: DoxX family protein [Rhizomicrobium sp.]|nr:DoxX family protein [Rhizomicrobium sp.]
MIFASPATLDSLLLSAVFAASGLIHVLGVGFVQRAYERWHFPPKFYRVTGVVNLLIAAFLAVPVTRIWGAVLAAIVMFIAVVTLLNHRQYAYSFPGMLLMALLVPAFLSSPI